MQANAELLNFIYQNSQMGVETVSQLIEMCDNSDFTEHLSKELSEYKSIHQKAGELLEKNGYDEKGINAFEKITAYLMINLKTITDKSAANMARILIEGSNKGIIDGVKKINEYENSTEKDIIDLMKKLKKLEEENVETLKKFL